MSTKENFVKALKELTGFEDSQSGSETATQAAAPEFQPSKVKVEPIHMNIEAPNLQTNEFNKNLSASFSEITRQEFGSKVVEETGRTSIPSGMKIVGDIESTDRIEMMGKVEGNISTTGDVVITGTVIGDVEAGDLLLQNSAVKGNVKAVGNVTVERDAKVVGNVSAENLRLDGRIKGNLNIAQTSELASGALVLGDIETGFISTSRGTRIKGNIFTKQIDDYGEDDFDIEV